MKQKIKLLIFVFCYIVKTNAQSENTIWYFGNSSSRIQVQALG
jgi:hypothetical protein